MAYIATWYEFRCPECNQKNFVCAGDTNDATGFDPEAVKCVKCGHCFDFEGEPVDEDETCYEDGVIMQKVNAE